MIGFLLVGRDTNVRFHIDDSVSFCQLSRNGVACTKTEEALERVDVMLNWFGKLER